MRREVLLLHAFPHDSRNLLTQSSHATTRTANCFIPRCCSAMMLSSGGGHVKQRRGARKESSWTRCFSRTVSKLIVFAILAKGRARRGPLLLRARSYTRRSLRSALQGPTRRCSLTMDERSGPNGKAFWKRSVSLGTSPSLLRVTAPSLSTTTNIRGAANEIWRSKFASFEDDVETSICILALLDAQGRQHSRERFSENMLDLRREDVRKLVGADDPRNERRRADMRKQMAAYEDQRWY